MAPPAEYVDVEIPNVVSPRINGKRMGAFTGKHVRIPCRITAVGVTHPVVAPALDIQQKDNERKNIMVQTSDELTITICGVEQDDLDKMSVGECIEAIGTVINEDSIQTETLIPMVGPEIDLAIVDRVVELIHDRRFFHKMFAPADYKCGRAGCGCGVDV
ncbi:hypothetical protein BDZ89DRAFT_1152659 [Hymenopellis radicata]|nr:hypothetical protein BDZ89DRAFT_1152659 [Hymenopellis radicata]